MKIETVQELIDKLQAIEDKSKPIFVYDNSTSQLSDINLIDTDLGDRVDLNIDTETVAETKSARVLKMIFLEREEIGADTYEFLDRNNIFEHVDYGNTELSADNFQELINNFDSYDKVKSDGEEITIQQIKEELGTDISELLLTGKLDFIQIIYE